MSKIAFMSTCAAVGTAVALCGFLAGTVSAKDREVTVAYRVTTQGLDPSQPAGAQELYSRLEHAAQVVCTHGMRVGLKPEADENACYQRALAQAIRSAKLPLLTRVYLETHTLREAAARGIEVPLTLAAK